ncbi:MAG: DUF5683 domain-containing protein [Fibrobacter sp.]|nr:DUF5683 domain-containing protein [Fibrobacter sp.]
MFYRLFLAILFVSLCGVVSAFADEDSTKVYVGGVYGKTGIESIDTLTVNEWDIPTKRNSLPLTMLFSIFPGGGQYYTEHYVRGGFITGIEGLLIYEVYFNKSFQKDRVYEQVRPFQDSVAIFTRKLMLNPERDSIRYYQQKRSEFANRVRELSDKKMEQEDLRTAENAWLFGVHLYSMFDAFGIWYNNNHRSTELKSMLKALLWGIIPGFGQMYNGEFGKAGLVYMSIIGATTSMRTSQHMVEYYLDRKHVLENETVTSEEYDKVVERITYYRKNRNQYIWGMALIYLYSLADAAVDALLSDFDSPMHFAVAPNLESRSGGVQAEFGFDF